MKSIVPYIKRSLSLKLCFGIMCFVVVIFVGSFSFLFFRSIMTVKQEAIQRATYTLEVTALRVSKLLGEVETITDNTERLAYRYLVPDSIWNYSHRVVEMNPNINGCSITMEPNFFPQKGEKFSIYTVRLGDEVKTVVEGDYNYYEKDWYKKAYDSGKACWIDPYNDFNEESTLSSPVMIASYCKPMRTPEDKIVGVVATDLSIGDIGKAVTSEKPYPNSYCVMLGSDGRYFVHPDRLKIIRQTIFNSEDAKENPALIDLGNEMIAGKTGHMNLQLKGEDCLVFYQPIANTPWSIALVCHTDDILGSYKRMISYLIPIFLIGLVIILFLCWCIIRRSIRPISELAELAHGITDQKYDLPFERSDRIDAVGELQNSFVDMQQSIKDHVKQIEEVNADTIEQNEQLKEAYELAKVADQRKTEFIHDLSLQIRTPLNIIAGFMQVLRDRSGEMPDDEVRKSIEDMKANTTLIIRMAHMMLDISWIGDTHSLTLSDKVMVQDVVDIAEKDFNDMPPFTLKLTVNNMLAPGAYVHSNHLYLNRTVRELLFNAKKFAANGMVTLAVTETEKAVRFIVEDQGPGIPESERERVFEPFVKMDKFSEGLGLGLGLVRNHIRNLRGVLYIDNDYKDGMRFVIDIPKD